MSVKICTLDVPDVDCRAELDDDDDSDLAGAVAALTSTEATLEVWAMPTSAPPTSHVR